MAPDMLTAYILWSAHPECENAAQNELQSRQVVLGLGPTSFCKPSLKAWESVLALFYNRRVSECTMLAEKAEL